MTHHPALAPGRVAVITGGAVTHLVLTHHQLLKEVWGSVQGAQPHYLRVYMAQLRQKLEADPAAPRRGGHDAAQDMRTPPPSVGGRWIRGAPAERGRRARGRGRGRRTARSARSAGRPGQRGGF